MKEVSIAKSFCLKHPKPKGGILILHGFSSYPGEMRYQAEALHHQGYTVEVPRLPGHGTSAEDFTSTPYTAWLKTALDWAREYRRNFSPFYIMGISMGGLLGIIAASETKPDGIILGAPALYLKNKFSKLSPILHYIMPKLRAREARDYGIEEKNYIDREYWIWHYPKAIKEFLKVQKLARKRIRELSCPMLLMEAQEDDTVSKRAIRRLLKAKNVRSIEHRILEQSEHQLFDGCERDMVKEYTSSWLVNQGNAEG